MAADKKRLDRQELARFRALVLDFAHTLELRAGYLRQYIARSIDGLTTDRDPNDADPAECFHIDGALILRPLLVAIAEEVPEYIEDIGEASACVVVDCDEDDGEE